MTSPQSSIWRSIWEQTSLEEFQLSVVGRMTAADTGGAQSSGIWYLTPSVLPSVASQSGAPPDLGAHHTNLLGGFLCSPSSTATQH